VRGEAECSNKRRKVVLWKEKVKRSTWNRFEEARISEKKARIAVQR
jgi:hypothetical protein